MRFWYFEHSYCQAEIRGMAHHTAWKEISIMLKFMVGPQDLYKREVKKKKSEEYKKLF